MFVRSQGLCIVLILNDSDMRFFVPATWSTNSTRPAFTNASLGTGTAPKEKLLLYGPGEEESSARFFAWFLYVTFCVWFGQIPLRVTVEVECFFVSVVQGLGMSQRSYSRCFPSRWRWHSSRRRGWGRCQTIDEFPGVFWNLLESVQVASGSRFLDMPWEGVGWSWHMAQHVQARCHPPWPKRRRLETSLQRMLN